ncbi:MAG: Flp pilus assembly complex ATPase component TadA [Candidatus Omnitrophica bacterium]|nr:Flp pilus assembly complex ATPase component TadA [Candidatus Omnitrophota bacterium]
MNSNEKNGLSDDKIEKLVDPEFLSIFPYNFLEKFSILPFKGDNGEVFIGTNNISRLDPGEIENFIGKKVKFLTINEDVVQNLLKKYYYHPTSSQKIVQELKGQDEKFVEDLPEDTGGDPLEFANQAPIIRLVNQIIYKAVSMRASDIHLQALEDQFKVRYRIDGILHDIFVLPKKYQSAIISRVKIISDLDIAEKRTSQDGRTSLRIDGQQIDIRISIIPTFFGESSVLRLLNKSVFLFDIESVGFTEENYEKFDKLIHCDHGIILLTGPTGSGKTTTLYSALSKINNPKTNIITLEDPVEYQLNGINQIQINPKVELTFANGLRSILRHDPDIIMVGEIRDLETAEMAIQASLTGHLVFSTLHTNDSTSAITRLLDMGIEPYLIASSVIAIAAQRLIRINCAYCKEEIKYPPEILRQMGFLSENNNESGLFVHGKGCSSCLQTGYYGRTGIFEMLMLDDRTRELIMQRVSAGEIRKYAVSNGLKTLRQDGAVKVKNQQTTISEVLRVTQEM